MAQIKMSKKATSIDMTAMCDVAFLLLTFFILTATAKVPEPINVDTPSSTNKTKLASDKLVIVTVGGGKENIFFDLKGKELRTRTLELMADKYKLSFTDEEKNKFSKMESFGVPIENLSGLLKLRNSDRNKPGTQLGIPFDTINNNENNQLKDWVYTARQANVELNPNGNELAFAIKGDAKLQYPKIKRIMDIYQDQTINVFDLVTGLRSSDY